MFADIVIIGAGVVGLAIAKELSSIFNCIVLEKHPSFGCETSSRNSEVIHAGLYYPQNSLKTELCIEGNRLIYEFAEKYKVPFNKIGKLVIAITKEQEEKLISIYENARRNGVCGIEYVSNTYLQKYSPCIKAHSAFISRNTGIIDTHSFMRCLEALAIENGTTFSYNSEVIDIKKTNSEFEIFIKIDEREIFSLKSPIIINSAGLHSDEIASMVGINDENLKINYCKGHYFKINSSIFDTKHLVYPVTDNNLGLGIHLTLDLNGGLKLGPDTSFLNSRQINYDVPNHLAEKFFTAGQSYIKGLTLEMLSPDYAGIRPKLQKPDENFRDFYITNETARNLDGFINLVGIESPGLTSSLAIAKYVRKLLT
ncbi:MAG: NAD(P)/FAD-dependent oxidoreductase [Bacteroidota bacterium]